MASISTIASSRFNDNIYTLATTPFSTTSSITISSNQKLIIPKGYTLVIINSTRFDNNGTIINYGTLIINGYLTSTGIMNNEFGGTITNNNTLENTGKILNRNIYQGQGLLYGNFPLNVNGGTYNSLKLAGCVLGGNIYTDYGDGTWTPQASVENWGSITSSASGQFLAACVNPGNSIYTSQDYGNNWSPSQIGTVNQNWYSIASSASGQFLVASVQFGGIYTSKDYGASWSITTAPSGPCWLSVASSASGQFLVAGIYQGAPSVGSIYTNNNYGDGQWTRQASSPASSVRSVASSASGQFLVACVAGGTIYTSNDYGITWSPSNAPSENWLSVTCSASGQFVVAGANVGNIYTSNDYGNTWSPSQTPSTDNQGWNSVASSASGQYLVACYTTGNGGGIYTSSDYGVTWSITSALSLVWTSVASSY